MTALFRHWRRIAVTLIPLVLVLLHATELSSIGVLQRLDDILYDARLRATMPRTMDDRIVIVDIDEKSLAEVGRFPWGRNRLAQLVDILFEQQQVALLGFDIVFSEPDTSSGLKQLRELSNNQLKDFTDFSQRVEQLAGELDYDAIFAAKLTNRPVVLGYYFSSDQDGRTSGVLPRPVMSEDAIKGRAAEPVTWRGFGANIPALVQAVPSAGHFNPIADADGVVRTIPLLAEYRGNLYESLALAMFRKLMKSPEVVLGFSSEKWLSKSLQAVDRIELKSDGISLPLYVDRHLATLIPYRGLGGPKAGSFRYVSAADILANRLEVGALKGKIILVGTTAPGLNDLRTAPVGEAYPGVESHANLISSWLDGKKLLKPDYALGYDVFVLVASGLVLALGLPLLSAARAVALSAGVLILVISLNTWLYQVHGLVMPLAATISLIVTAFGLNMSYGYFVETRTKRELAHLFGTYVPPELVDEMVKDPDSYSMTAASRELTVMFCDMRGFTKMSENMDPTQLQALLTGVFSTLTAVIRSNRGTIDKYMGDCVMAFWGAPVDIPDHASLSVKAALEMVQAVAGINADHRTRGLPEIGIGIGLNTGVMCVGDMGSNIRRAYTVIGDSVNLGSRLEGLSKVYGTEIVASETTRKLTKGFAWQELDRVRVKGKDQAVAIFSPIAQEGTFNEGLAVELRTWAQLLKSYRAQQWDQADVLLLNLNRINANKFLYTLYAERIASMRLLPFDPEWDGATNFDSK